MPPQFGSGDCSDSSNIAAGFQHIDADTSNPKEDLLALLLGVLSGPITVFRPDAQKHLVVLTNSDVPSNAEFVGSQLVGLGPSYLYTRVHAVAGGGGAGACTKTPSLTSIAAAWNGEVITMCPLDTMNLFAALRPNPACVFDLPTLPNGVEVSAIQELTVVAGGPGRAELAVEEIESIEGCISVSNGAVLQGTRVQLCPQVCAEYQDLSGVMPGALRFAFETCEEG